MFEAKPFFKPMATKNLTNCQITSLHKAYICFDEKSLSVYDLLKYINGQKIDKQPKQLYLHWHNVHFLERK